MSPIGFFEDTVEKKMRRLTEIKLPGGAFTRVAQGEGEREEATQLRMIKSMLSEFSGYDAGYEPEKEPSSFWKNFAERHRPLLDSVGGADYVYKRIRKCGMMWAKQRDYAETHPSYASAPIS
jgi:hypothetical protein